MCILGDEEKMKSWRAKGLQQLTLWKVIAANDSIGLWQDTFRSATFSIGENVAESFWLYPSSEYGSFYSSPGQFHCFFSRKAARRYKKFRVCRAKTTQRTSLKLKIIKAYANTEDIVSVGKDELTDILAISVSKITIESLEHQR